MNKYITLLRGINVGGHRKIKMADLKEMFESLGYKNVKTYIQSGNVIFDTNAQKEEELSETITLQIAESFCHDVPVLIRKPKELKKVFRAFPFEEKEGWKGYIGFLSDKADSDSIEKLESQSSHIEKLSVSDNHFYISVNKETTQKPAFSNRVIEKELGLYATTRNLRTVKKVLELVDNFN